MTQIVIDQKNNNSTLDVSVGDIVLITLSENPTTGYRWQPNRVDEEIILLKDSKYDTSGNGIGSGGIRTFTFEARSTGTTKVSCDLRREWEKEKKSIQQFQVFIQVK